MLLGALAAGLGYSAPIRALIIDGQNNHDWKSTTPALKKILEAGLPTRLADRLAVGK